MQICCRNDAGLSYCIPIHAEGGGIMGGMLILAVIGVYVLACLWERTVL